MRYSFRRADFELSHDWADFELSHDWADFEVSHHWDDINLSHIHTRWLREGARYLRGQEPSI